MGLVENTPQRANWDFVLSRDNRSVDDISGPPYEFDVTASFGRPR